MPVWSEVSLCQQMVHIIHPATPGSKAQVLVVTPSELLQFQTELTGMPVSPLTTNITSLQTHATIIVTEHLKISLVIFPLHILS